MNNKKESALSPVISVVLILALVGVIAAMVSFSVISNVDNIVINDVKDVDVTIKISGSDMFVYMVSGKDLISLDNYTIYLIGDGVFTPLVYGIDSYGDSINDCKYPGSINDDISYINIVGNFTDGEQAVIFTGKIVDGYVVQTTVVEDERLFWVKYDDNNDKDISDVPVDDKLYKSGDFVTVDFTVIPTKNRYTFNGWNTRADGSGTLYTDTGTNTFPIYQNTTLYANYTESFTVKYYNNFDGSGGSLIQTNPYNPGDTVTVIGAISRLPDILYTYKFSYWATNNDGSGDIYNPGQEFLINSDLTLYAKWIRTPILSKYPVTYNMNGGRGSVVDHNSPYTPNSIVDVLPLDDDKQTQIIDGTTYYFVSWNTKFDGTGISYYYLDTFTITEPTTLYAVWTTQDPYFRHGTYSSGTQTNYYSPDALITAINNWKSNTISIVSSTDNYYTKDYTVTLNKDIPLADEPILLKSNWNLTIIVNDTFETTKIGNVYPSTNPNIWAAPVHNEIESLFVLDQGSPKLNLGTDLVLDGNYRMQESIIKVSRNSELNVGNNDLTIVNGIRGNRAITTDGGGIYNSGTVTTDGGEIRIDNCWALNGGGFYNYGSNTIYGPNAYANVTLNITNCRADFVKDSKPQGAGGGIYSYYSTTVLKSGSVIDNCYATENGGGIFAFDPHSFEIQEGSKIINNRAESPDKGNGGGIFLHYGDLKIYKSIISGNTASGNGGGIYNYYTSSGNGIVNLYYDESSNPIDYSIYNNTAKEGGGIYNCAGSHIKYNDYNPGNLGENNNAYDWFRNIHLVNDAVTHKNYNSLDNPITKYYTEGKSYGNTVSGLNDSINEWSNLVYGFNLVSSNGNELIPISDYPIIISGDPIEINMDMKITGSETLYIISAPGYDGVLLKINNTKKLTSSSDVIIDGNGISDRTQSIVVVNNGAELNINGGDFSVKYGYNSGGSGVSETANVNGGGINNAGTINVNDGGKLDVSKNKIRVSLTGGSGGDGDNGNSRNRDGDAGGDGGDATVNAYGGGIYNTGTINVNNGGNLDVNNNEVNVSVKGGSGGSGGSGYHIIIYHGSGGDGGDGGNATIDAYGGGIYNAKTINVNNGGKLDVNNNEVNALATGGSGGSGGSGDSHGSDGAVGTATANALGGGIYNANTKTINVNNGGNLDVNNNEVDASATKGNGDVGTANANGGGIYNYGGTITNSDSTQIILENNEAKNGGGICSTTSSTDNNNYYKINVTAKGNTATNRGGGIYNTGGYVEINGYISGNTATNNGGGIYSAYRDNTRTVKINATVSENTANYGGGIHTGSVSEVSGIVSDNTANADGGGIYNTGIINLNYPDSNALIYSINGNTADSNGGGICTKDIMNVLYKDIQVSNLAEGDVKRWFQNINPVAPYNSANTGDNSYPSLVAPGYFTSSGDYSYTDSARLINRINLWAIDYFGEPIFDESNNVISSKPIIVASNPITIKTDLNIGGTDTLNIVSAPGYKGALLSITASGTGLTTSANVVVNGNDYKGKTITGRTSALVNIISGGKLNVIGGIFTVQNGNTATNNVGGGIYNNMGMITVNSGSKLYVYNNTANNGGGIYNTGDSGQIIVNDGGIVTIQSNTATTTSQTSGGGGIYNNYYGSITNSGMLTIIENKARNGGGIYIYSGKMTNTGGTTSPSGDPSIIFYNNEASEYGGGLYVYDEGSVVNSITVDGRYPRMHFYSNTADNRGSAIYTRTDITSWPNVDDNYGIYGTNNQPKPYSKRNNDNQPSDIMKLT